MKYHMERETLDEGFDPYEWDVRDLDHKPPLFALLNRAYFPKKAKKFKDDDAIWNFGMKVELENVRQHDRDKITAIYYAAPPPHGDRRDRHTLAPRERFLTEHLHVVWMPKGKWPGPTARPM